MTTSDFFKDTVFQRSDSLSLVLCAFVIGVLLGFFMDIASMAYSTFGRNAVFVFATDLFAVTMAYLLLFACALHFNYGIIRWYHLIIAPTALFIYKRTLSKTVVRITKAVSRLLLRVGRFAVRLVSYPFRLLQRAADTFLSAVCAYVTECLYKWEYNRKFIKYYKSASCAFGLVADMGEEKENVKKNRSSRHTACNSASDSCGIRPSDGAKRASRRGKRARKTA